MPRKTSITLPAQVIDLMDVIWLLKLMLLISVIRYLRIFGPQSLVIYLISIIAVVFLKPENYDKAPEYILFMTILLFLGYILGLSINDILRNYKNIKLEFIFNIAAFKKYIHFFSAMVVISFMLSFLNLQFVESIFLIIVFFIVLEFIKMNIPHIKSRFLSYDALSIIVILFLLFSSKYRLLMVVINQSLFSCGLLMFFSFVKSFNTYVCPLNELREGMLPAETITIEGNRFVKSDMPYISVPVYFRKKIADQVFKRKDFVTPFKPLTEKDISVLRKKTDFDILRIQRVINLRIFLVLGTIISFFLI